MPAHSGCRCLGCCLRRGIDFGHRGENATLNGVGNQGFKGHDLPFSGVTGDPPDSPRATGAWRTAGAVVQRWACQEWRGRTGRRMEHPAGPEASLCGQPSPWRRLHQGGMRRLAGVPCHRTRCDQAPRTGRAWSIGGASVGGHGSVSGWSRMCVLRRSRTHNMRDEISASSAYCSRQFAPGLTPRTAWRRGSFPPAIREWINDPRRIEARLAAVVRSKCSGAAAEKKPASEGGSSCD